MKMRFDNSIQAFLSLVRAGLWEKDVRLSQYGIIDFYEILRLSEEQSVVGLVAAGIEHVIDGKLPQDVSLQFVGQALQLEQRNSAMNHFIGILVDEMRQADIHTLLIKGQGLAQCYERPQWRAAGDVDFYLSETNYEKAKAFLSPLAQHVDEEDKRRKHYGITIEPWLVELHGTMHTDLSRRVNKVLDEIHHALFYGGDVRSWNDEGVTIFLPNFDDDVILVFTHFMGHFYGRGIGLRQVCDWCRLLYKHKDDLNLELLRSYVNNMGLMTEWLAFETFAVEYLGMPDYILLADDNIGKYCKKAERICELILKTGNLGHNNDESYKDRYSGLVLIFKTFWRRLLEYTKIFPIFPMNTPKFFLTYILNRVK